MIVTYSLRWSQIGPRLILAGVIAACGHIGVDVDGDDSITLGGASMGGESSSGARPGFGAGVGVAGGDGTGASGPTTGSGGEPAGTGGTPVVCLDDDADGETTCDGDCDDSDFFASTRLGEICGDGVDNNCDGSTDEGCMGLGTFVSALVGDDANSGTQDAPVKSISAGLANAATLGGNTAVIVAEGNYPESITMIEGISLYGGHQCDGNSCTWARDRTAHESIIQAQSANGITMDATITRRTVLDGFRVLGQNGGNASDGRATINVAGGAPTITNNRIIGGSNNGGAWLDNRSLGLRFSLGTVGNERALVEGNEIAGGTSQNGSSVGLALETWMTNNLPVKVDIIGNVIRGGVGENTVGVALWAAAGDVLVEGNDIGGGDATADTSHGVAGGGQFVLHANRINVNGRGSCATNSGKYCSGFHSESATATVTNNVIIGPDAPWSAGVQLSEAETPAGRVVLNSNTVDGGGSVTQARSAALVVQIGTCDTCGFNASVGEVRNNILSGGSAQARFGVYEEAPVGKDQHPNILEYNLFFLRQPTTANDHLYRLYDAMTGETFLDTMTEVNNLQNLALRTVLSRNNVRGNPLLDGSHHLMTGSAAIDVGTATDAPQVDRDGDSRPQGGGYDVGADEVP